MTLQDEYTNTTTTIARRAEEAWTEAADAWSKNVSKVTDQIRTPFGPELTIEPAAFVEQWFGFTERVAKAHRDYVVNLANVANAFGGAVRQHVEDLTEAVRDQAQVASETAKSQVDKVAEAEREQAERAEQAEREEARAARNAERQRARQARQSAREQYEGQTKAELSDELGRRDLPKSGNVEELIERLVDADTA